MISLVAVIIGLPFLIVLPIYVYLIWNHRYWYKRGLVTARPITLLGTYPGILTRSCNLVEDVQRIYDKYKKDHRVVGVFVTRQPQLLVIDPQLAHEILVTNYRCYRDSLTSAYIKHAKWDKYACRNPFWASGETWKNLRSDGKAGISLNRLKQAYEIWQHNGKKLTNFIELCTNANENIIEARDLCFRYTTDVMSDFIWGIDAGALAQPYTSNKVQQMAIKWTSHAFYMISIFMASILLPFSRVLFRLRFYPKDTDEFFSNLTSESIRMRMNETGNRSDYLSHLLQLREQKQASHDDLVGHALTVMLDGYDTTGAALLHAVFHLAEYPVVQHKLRMEIMDNFSVEKAFSFEQINALPYLDQCVYESLRLSSLIPQYTKVCTTGTHILLKEGKSVKVEEGMTVMIPNYQFHHDKKYFPDPEIFKPERFNDAEHHRLISLGVLLPFSDGPRICMGQRLALLTIKSALVHIVSSYRIARSKDVVTISGDSGFGINLQGDVNLEFRRLK